MFDLSLLLDRSPRVACLYESEMDELLGLADLFDDIDDEDEEDFDDLPFSSFEDF